MAEAFIEELYAYANTISELRWIVERYRRREDFSTLDYYKEILPKIQKLLDACIAADYTEAELLFDALTQVGRQNDLILAADLLENTVIPCMEKWVQSLGEIEVQADKRYRIESTSSGFLTIKHTGADRYYHSNNDPMDEARRNIEKLYNYEKDKYRIWGCGLGYQIYQLYRISDGSIPIYLYEMDENLLQYAYHYGVLSWIPNDVLHVIWVDDINQFIEDTQNEDGILFFLPEIQSMEDRIQKTTLMQYYHARSFFYEAEREWRTNFYRNKELGLPDVSRLDRSLMKKEVVIIAGGPSVDLEIDLLRQWQGEKSLIAVGTIWKRLLKEGITPDYAVIMDPYPSTFKNVEGIEDQETILLLSLQSYWKIARSYSGPIYTVCNSCGGSEIQQYAENNGLELWLSGGTVTILALEFAIRFFVDKIFFLGVDMAFPGGTSHARGTDEYSEVDLSNKIPIESVNGETVYTDEILDSYRKKMEEIIELTEGIEYINLSRIGAKIKGTKSFWKTEEERE